MLTTGIQNLPEPLAQAQAAYHDGTARLAPASADRLARRWEHFASSVQFALDDPDAARRLRALTKDLRTVAAGHPASAGPAGGDGARGRGLREHPDRRPGHRIAALGHPGRLRPGVPRLLRRRGGRPLHLRPGGQARRADGRRRRPRRPGLQAPPGRSLPLRDSARSSPRPWSTTPVT